MKHFSERLRHARQYRGLSQADLARLCGLTQSAISNYENGTRRDTWPFNRFSVDEIVALPPKERDHLDQTIRHLLNGMKRK
ncbi:helix-turn-helix domain-containing protein [Alcaligenes aquatilis]|uniref:helix-turn-helix domain-containing protein n=1 Tax=Alcaligenes aquatilis TaxID=323284 RepID=UPI00361FB6C2